MNIVRVERVDFQLVPGIAIEFYRFPDGEKRIGITSAAVVCGLKKNYFAELELKTPRQLEALRAEGFTGSSREGLVGRKSAGGRGASKASTMNLDDFVAFVKFVAFELGKPQAKAIAKGLMGVAIETIARQAFHETPLTPKQIYRSVISEYVKSVDWLAEDREDARLIDEHQLFLAMD